MALATAGENERNKKVPGKAVDETSERLHEGAARYRVRKAAKAKTR